VIHCFSYSPELAKIYLRKGFYLGIGGVVTFKNSKKLKEVVEMAPLEQMVLETDAPYLTPAPNRGQRNDSRQLVYVVDMIAGLKGISPEEVVKVTEENARRLYRL
jgi:TatD DNase family protein